MVVVVAMQERVVIVVVVVVCVLNSRSWANITGANVVVEIGASPDHVPLSIQGSSSSSSGIAYDVHCLRLFFSFLFLFRSTAKKDEVDEGGRRV